MYANVVYGDGDRNDVDFDELSKIILSEAKERVHLDLVVAATSPHHPPVSKHSVPGCAMVTLDVMLSRCDAGAAPAGFPCCRRCAAPALTVSRVAGTRER